MPLKLIPNAALYRVVLPLFSDLAKNLATLPHTELQPTAGKGSGFIPVPNTGEIVHTFVGGLAFSLRYDEKILPGSVINAELKKWAAGYAEREGHKPGRKLLKDMREGITAELLATAFVRSKVVTCLYHYESETLIVPTTSSKLKTEIMGQLVRAVDSLKTTSIHVSEAKGSLTNRLLSAISGAEGAFPGFEIGSKAVLSSESGKITFDVDGLETTADKGLAEAISAGAQVTELALSANGVNFRLTSDFMLKGVKFSKGAVEYENEGGDPRFEFEQEAAIQTLLVAKVLTSLCEMFGYTPPADDGGDLC